MWSGLKTAKGKKNKVKKKSQVINTEKRKGKELGVEFDNMYLMNE